MSDWITDRLPTEEDAVHYCVLLWDEDEGVIVWSYDAVNEGQPWMPILKPEPYVKPKRWTVDRFTTSYRVTDGGYTYTFPEPCTAEIAQRFCDLFNEVLP